MRPSMHLVLLAGILLSPTALPAQDETPPSIEELIERYRERSVAVIEAQRTEVNALLERLNEHCRDDEQKLVEQTRAMIIDLGSQIAPLLIDSLDPGQIPDNQDLNFSAQIVVILQNLSLAPVHDRLIQMARSGSITGRHRAVEVLGYSEDIALVSPVLTGLYSDGESISRSVILEAIARLGGDENLDFITDRLLSGSRKDRDAALAALTVTKESGVADKILLLVSDTRTASKHMEALSDWYAACPGVFDRKHLEAVLEIVKISRLTDDRLAALNLIAGHKSLLNASAKKALRDIAKRGDQEFRKEVLIVLARSGDGKAKRDLIEPLEERLRNSYFGSDSYTELAEIHYRIGDYREAIKWYKGAINDGFYSSSRKSAAHLGLARCYALKKDYRAAEESLTSSGLGYAKLTELANDPDFVKMASVSRYQGVFGIED